MSTTSRLLSSSAVKSIMSKRITIPELAVGKRVRMLVQGDGVVIDVKDKDGELVLSTIPGQEGVVLQKKIFNAKANSALALVNPRNRQFIMDGLKAEKAGKAAEAHDFFNQYLNAAQISFGVLLPSTVADKLHNGDEIAATIIRVDTENGSLLTIDPSTISVLEPETYVTANFDLADFEAAMAAETKPKADTAKKGATATK